MSRQLLLYGCSYLLSKASGVRLQPKYYNLWCVCVRVCVRLSPTERLLTESYHTWAVRGGVVNVSTRRDLYYAYIVFYFMRSASARDEITDGWTLQRAIDSVEPCFY